MGKIRSRPKQHRRRLPSGKTIIVNKGVRGKKKLSRYQTPRGTFKKMTDPDRVSKKKSKFYGCERAMRSKGYKPKSSTKICGAISARKRYGFLPKKNKQTEWLELDDPRLRGEGQVDLEKFGRVKRVSGKKIGRGVAASGAVVPVVLPLPLTVAAGAAIEKRIENVKFIMTDEHDKPFKIPRVQVERKKNFGYIVNPKTLANRVGQGKMKNGEILVWKEQPNMPIKDEKKLEEQVSYHTATKKRRGDLSTNAKKILQINTSNYLISRNKKEKGEL